MAQQTAVDWIVEEINKISVSREATLFIEKLRKQAKQMEKDQLMDAVSYGDCRGRITTYLTDEQYYNETYGK